MHHAHRTKDKGRYDEISNQIETINKERILKIKKWKFWS